MEAVALEHSSFSFQGFMRSYYSFNRCAFLHGGEFIICSRLVVIISFVIVYFALIF